MMKKLVLFSAVGFSFPGCAGENEKNPQNLPRQKPSFFTGYDPRIGADSVALSEPAKALKAAMKALRRQNPEPLKTECKRLTELVKSEKEAGDLFWELARFSLIDQFEVGLEMHLDLYDFPRLAGDPKFDTWIRGVGENVLRDCMAVEGVGEVE
jgi:hypothetical protein